MKKTVLATLIASGVAASAPAFAGNIQDELAALKQRIAQLESQLAETQEVQKAQARSVAESASAGNWTDKVSISGSAEFLGTATENDNDSSESDLDVDSVELTIDAQVNENMALTTTLKYEDDGEQGNGDFYVYEAALEISDEASPWSFTVGRTEVPFAVVNGNAWSDPLTYELTENFDDLAIVGYNEGIFSAAAYVYRGRHDDSKQNKVENVGLNLGLAFENGFSVGAGYLNNIRTSDPLRVDSLTARDKVSAARLNVAYEMEALALSAEYMKTGSFDELAGQPEVTAWHVSADYGTDIFGAPGNLSLGYSATDDAELITDGGDVVFAESRITLGASRELNDNAELIVEAVREEAYNGDETDTLNLVLSTSF